MWQDIWAVNLEYAWNNSHWWKTIQLLKMWQDIWAVNLKYAWNNSHWWKTIQLLKMWPDIWAINLKYTWNNNNIGWFFHQCELFHVYFKLTAQITCHIWAFVRFFTSVNYFLHILSWLLKCFVTFWALLWFFNNGVTLLLNSDFS